MQHLMNVHDIDPRLWLHETIDRLHLREQLARLRPRAETVEKAGRWFTFAVVFAVGWYLMFWAWGDLVGGLMGWIPAVGLAATLAPSWRVVLVGGALMAVMQASGKIV